ncbi:MAG: ABC transporter permease [Defluviitaleaceae bacterium]|nr:ABC transporter permease [Defluviitaleaceae bacterium]MCL2835355.1 ABC transporter permease [Defluviitaleaceae bacterium]
MTIGVYMSYRVMNMPDLTAEGSIVLGAAVSAVIIAQGGNPFLATLAAIPAGMTAGLVTGVLHTKLKIPGLLSGILCMIALYSINIRVMLGAANVSLLRRRTVFTGLIETGLSRNMSTLILGAVCAALAVTVVYCFYGTEIGCAVRATGNNDEMAKAQGVNTDMAKVMSLVISNGLIALSGSLICQYLGFSDIQMGIGAIVIGLASLIIGEVLFAGRTFKRALIAMVFGSLVYRFVIAMVLEAGMPATDLKLFTAITVAIALSLPNLKKKLGKSKGKLVDWQGRK